MGGIQALCALWVIDNAILSLATLMMLEPVTFFLWALSEDLTNIFILRRHAEPEDRPYVLMRASIMLRKSFQWSLLRLINKELWLYWLGDVLLSKLAGATSISEATPEMRALIAFVKTVVFFETFLFFGICCPDAL